MKYNSELAKKIIECFGPSGREEKIAELIVNEIKDYADEISIDVLGNVIARKKGTGKKIMFSAHMDQIGLIVTKIDDKGFIRICPVGGIDHFQLYGQRIIFENGVEGIVTKDRLGDISKITMQNLHIDIGTLSKEETESKISVGDMCIYKSSYYENDNCVITPYLDDRIGCYALIEAIKVQKETKNDCYYVFSTQEEVGARGAKTAGYKIEPDMFVAIDVAPTGDTMPSLDTKIGGGVALTIMNGKIICSPKINKVITDIADENNINYQFIVADKGGTDTGTVHILRSGILSAEVAIPTRYGHSSGAVAHKSDIEKCMLLISKIAEKYETA